MQLSRLCSALLALAPVVVRAQATPTTTTPAPTTTTTTTTPTASPQRDRPFASFDTASQTVREAVSGASSSAATAAASLDEAIRLGVVRPATLATTQTPALPPSVEALPAAVTRANTAIVAESRTARAPDLTRRESSLARLRQAQSEPERQRIIEELRTTSGQRLEAQREDARLVRDRLRQLRELTTLNRPSGN